MNTFINSKAKPFVSNLLELFEESHEIHYHHSSLRLHGFNGVFNAVNHCLTQTVSFQKKSEKSGMVKLYRNGPGIMTKTRIKKLNIQKMAIVHSLSYYSAIFIILRP